MEERTTKPKVWVLLLGDFVLLVLVTIAGFASHQTLSSAGTRMLTTFVPFVLAWFPVAWSLEAFDLQKAIQPRELWRPVWAMVLAGLLAAWLRGVWLQSVIIPVFAAVLGGVGAVGMLIWRTIYCMVIYRE